MNRNWKLAAGSALLVIGFVILREHWGHVLGSLPYLLLIACPLLHVFGGHGDHSGHAHHEPPPDERKT